MTKHRREKMSEAQLAVLIDEARQTGQSLAALAQVHGLFPKRLYMARWQMRKRGFMIQQCKGVLHCASFCEQR